MSDTIHFPCCGITGKREALLLAIDDVLLPVKNKLCYYLSKPVVRPQPVLEASIGNPHAPDQLAAHFYGTVLYDAGIFRMWYYACHLGRNPDWSEDFNRQLAKQTDQLYSCPLCYAESNDGIDWHKPALGQLSFYGNCENNGLALPYALVPGCAAVIRDDDDPDPRRRYKMIYNIDVSKCDPPMEGVIPLPTCAAAVSADGISWQDAGLPYPLDFIEHASLYQHDGRYIINAHTVESFICGEGGSRQGRQGFARFSPDFINWVDGYVESFTLPEPQNPQLRGCNGLYSQVHIGVGAASFGTVCVGLYGIWDNSHSDQGFETISCDLGLVISNDGLHFREPVKGHIYLDRRDSLVTPYPGVEYPTVLCQANGILNYGDETRIYHGRWRNSGYDELRYGGEVALATIPRDRWGALGLFPDAQCGTVWSAPISIPENCSITLNADYAEDITVEIADADFHLITSCSGENAGQGHGSGLDCPVSWQGQPVMPLAAGSTVRLKLSLTRVNGREPRLFGITLRSAK